GLEQAHRPALAHHDHRPPQLGTWVMIYTGWYNMFGKLKDWRRVRTRYGDARAPSCPPSASSQPSPRGYRNES
ncbi:hypothetical protein, partial [Erythrobacter sanguineus]|uniref:hypothetical protein n=1 Tax=Erythrobacter sanguineus TaxID=198312 RepID=UPI001C49FD91